MSTKQYSIVGMHCEHCVATVARVVSEAKGTSQVSVSLAQGTLTMEVDETIFDEALFVETLGEEGFGIN